MADDLVEAVCSAKPRPSVQGASKGNQYWRRDVWHIREKYEDQTLCGRDCTEWLSIGRIKPDDHLCERCRKKSAPPRPAGKENE